MTSVLIKHTTFYEYTEQVFLEPHTLRLTPRPSDYIRLCSQAITISPEPAGISEMTDIDGTIAKAIWFDTTTSSFKISIETVMQTKPVNPFNFLINPISCVCLPMVYPDALQAQLSSYLLPKELAVKELATTLAHSCNYSTIPTITKLCTHIQETFSYEKREDGPPQTAADTIVSHQGTCRDFAVLAMAVCRDLGLASRFVSGYFLGDQPEAAGELHAWFEVYLPGVGWKGFDPSNGIACTCQHIPLAASSNPAFTMPVTGTLRGATTVNKMSSEIVISQTH